MSRRGQGHVRRAVRGAAGSSASPAPQARRSSTSASRLGKADAIAGDAWMALGRKDRRGGQRAPRSPSASTGWATRKPTCGARARRGRLLGSFEDFGSNPTPSLGSVKTVHVSPSPASTSPRDAPVRPRRPASRSRSSSSRRRRTSSRRRRKDCNHRSVPRNLLGEDPREGGVRGDGHMKLPRRRRGVRRASKVHPPDLQGRGRQRPPPSPARDSRSTRAVTTSRRAPGP